MPAQVLIVDCEKASRELLSLNLGRAGYVVRCAAEADAALLEVEDQLPDMLLLDWNLPGPSGIALMRRLRAGAQTRDLPIIMVTARNGEADKVMALESGADDYVTKPFSPRELLARVQCVLRRRVGTWTPDTVQMAGLRLDPSTLRVTAGARQIVLGRVEFKLLNFLMHHPERVHTRAQLLDQVWGNNAYLDERTVDAHVGRLRHALQASGHQRHIETVRGSGYRFVAWQQQAGLSGWSAR